MTDREWADESKLNIVFDEDSGGSWEQDRTQIAIGEKGQWWIRNASNCSCDWAEIEDFAWEKLDPITFIQQESNKIFKSAEYKFIAAHIEAAMKYTTKEKEGTE